MRFKGFLNYVRLAVFCSLLCVGYSAHPYVCKSNKFIKITLNNPPTDYVIWQANGSALVPVKNQLSETVAGRKNGFDFFIPSDCIVKDKSGSIHISKTLEAWRRNTPLKAGQPITQNGIPRYPFKDAHGRTRYVALKHITDQSKRFEAMYGTNLAIAEHGPKAAAPVSSKQENLSDAFQKRIDVAHEVGAPLVSKRKAIETIEASKDLQLTLKNPRDKSPAGKEYGVYQYNPKTGLLEAVKGVSPSSLAGTGGRLQFTIPENYKVMDENGNIDYQASLENWRRNTPRQLGNPITQNGIAHYPLTDAEGNTRYLPLNQMQADMETLNAKADPTNRTSLNYPYLEYIGDAKEPLVVDLPLKAPSRDKLKDLRLQSAKESQYRKTAEQTKSVLTESSNSEYQRYNRSNKNLTDHLIKQLMSLKASGASLNCTNSTDQHICMACNCVNEAGNQDFAGQVAVGRTVLSRMARVGFKSTACGVIWDKAYNRKTRKYTAAFSWTLMRARKIPRSGDMKNSCIDASIKAAQVGIWEWDHYYNPDLASPPWGIDGPRSLGSRGNVVVQDHTFLNSGYPLKSGVIKAIKNILAASEGAR